VVVAVLRRVFVVVGVVLRQCMSFFPLDKDMGEWVSPVPLFRPVATLHTKGGFT